MIPNGSIDGNISISWAASGAFSPSYKVEESLTSDFSVVKEVYSGSVNFVMLGGKSNNRYFYRVKVTQQGSTDSLWTVGLNSCLVTLPASAPLWINLPASNLTGAYTINWGASSTIGATYVIEESTTSDFLSVITVYSGPSRTVNLNGRFGGTYYYRVKAIAPGYSSSSYLNSTYGCVVNINLLAPSWVLVPSGSVDGNISISWAMSGAFSPSYKVEESLNSDFSVVKEVYSGSANFVVLEGKSNNEYFYRVKVTQQGSTDSLWSVGANSCLITLPVDGPLWIAVPASNVTGEIGLSWGSSQTAGVTYVVEESLDIDFAVSYFVYSGVNKAVVLSGRGGNVYYYRVKATKAGYPSSSWQKGANPCDVRPFLSIPSWIAVPSVSLTGGIYIRWSPSGAETPTYILEESTDPTFASTNVVYTGSSPNVSLEGRIADHYYYRIRVIKPGYIDSGWKNGSNGCEVPLAPLWISVPITSNTGDILVKWKAALISGANYVLEVSTSPTFEPTETTEIYNGSSTQFIIYGANNGAYHYRVKAIAPDLTESEWTVGQNACVVTK
jgi:hypothetical protein